MLSKKFKQYACVGVLLPMLALTACSIGPVRVIGLTEEDNVIVHEGVIDGINFVAHQEDREFKHRAKIYAGPTGSFEIVGLVEENDVITILAYNEDRTLGIVNHNGKTAFVRTEDLVFKDGDPLVSIVATQSTTPVTQVTFEQHIRVTVSTRPSVDTATTNGSAETDPTQDGTEETTRSTEPTTPTTTQPTTPEATTPTTTNTTVEPTSPTAPAPEPTEPTEPEAPVTEPVTWLSIEERIMYPPNPESINVYEGIIFAELSLTGTVISAENVYEQPSEEATVLTKLDSGTRVSVLGVSASNFLRVQLADGGLGYLPNYVVREVR